MRRAFIALGLAAAATRLFAAPALDDLRVQANRPLPAVAAPAAVHVGADVSRDYQAAFAHPAWPQARLDKLRRYKILLVPGFMANGIFHRWAESASGQPVLLADKSDPIKDLALDERESKEQFGALASLAGQKRRLRRARSHQHASDLGLQL